MDDFEIGDKAKLVDVPKHFTDLVGQTVTVLPPTSSKNKNNVTIRLGNGFVVTVGRHQLKKIMRQFV